MLFESLVYCIDLKDDHRIPIQVFFDTNKIKKKLKTLKKCFVEI